MRNLNSYFQTDKINLLLAGMSLKNKISLNAAGSQKYLSVGYEPGTGFANITATWQLNGEIQAEFCCLLEHFTQSLLGLLKNSVG
jgi:hypothetical protein